MTKRSAKRHNGGTDTAYPYTLQYVSIKLSSAYSAVYEGKYQVLRPHTWMHGEATISVAAVDAAPQRDETMVLQVRGRDCMLPRHRAHSVPWYFHELMKDCQDNHFQA